MNAAQCADAWANYSGVNYDSFSGRSSEVQCAGSHINSSHSSSPYTEDHCAELDTDICTGGHDLDFLSAANGASDEDDGG
eukprot:CAMPEP_0172191426 /NCGR_PEP_ID=MMETSP1050-20130122/23696_1 /TAXON_ID=233186 /ORGANISM="Cryptomonas curvata, Strain CCAP979/52" /LENGTH=79 /DNA_ID=CAMNT_0012866477 /DNA_START=168 /DNA_END=404 /DNA_ORIENTATION=-